MTDKIILDKKTLKIIMSETRVKILKSLNKKKKTLTELAKELKLTNPTIKEHLEILLNAKFIEKEKSIRKWKYYNLTIEGKKILNPEHNNLFLALVVSVFCVLIFSTIFIISPSNSLEKSDYDILKIEKTKAVSYGVDYESYGDYAPNNTKTLTKNTNIIILIILIIISLILGIFYLIKKRKLYMYLANLGY